MVIFWEPAKALEVKREKERRTARKAENECILRRIVEIGQD